MLRSLQVLFWSFWMDRKPVAQLINISDHSGLFIKYNYRSGANHTTPRVDEKTALWREY